ncbi:MAG: hypothetical protein VW292_10440 [Alphaproteobacteria bacterium]
MIENYEIEHLAEGATRIQEKFIAPMDMSLLLQAPLFFFFKWRSHSTPNCTSNLVMASRHCLMVCKSV